MSTEKVRKTGGNNVPLVEQEADAICIAGNTVDRQPQNGGNGLGCQRDDLAYTLTATDRHSGLQPASVWMTFRHNDDGKYHRVRASVQGRNRPDLPTGRSLGCGLPESHSSS